MQSSHYGDLVPEASHLVFLWLGALISGLGTVVSLLSRRLFRARYVSAAVALILC